MSKVSTIFSNIFTRSKRSKLEVDAVPISNNRRSQQCENNNIDNNRIVNSFLNENHESSSIPSSINNSIETMPSIDYTNSSNESLVLVATTPTTPTTINHNNDMNLIANNSNLQNQISPQVSSLSPSFTNNSLAISNTQGHTVYQFKNANNIHIGNVFNIKNDKISYNPKMKDNKLSHKKRRTPTIEKMMESKESLNRDMIDLISTHIGEGWRDIMRMLNYTEGEIFLKEHDFKIEGIKEVIYQLLWEWSNNAENATLGEITTVLWKGNKREVVYRMKELWKEKNSHDNNNESEI